MADEEIEKLLNTPDENGIYWGYYDFGYGVTEAEKIRQDLVGWWVQVQCADCSDDPFAFPCPTHQATWAKIERLAELAGAKWIEPPEGLPPTDDNAPF